MDTVEVLTDSFGPNNSFGASNSSATITSSNNHTDQLSETTDTFPSLVMPFSDPQSHGEKTSHSVGTEFNKHEQVFLYWTLETVNFFGTKQ